MKHSELLLCVPYDTLDVAQRMAAIDAARRAGMRLAETDPQPVYCDCPEQAMPHTCPPTAKLYPAHAQAIDYVLAVLEPAYYADLIDMSDPSFNIADFDETDPRVAAFISAANKRYDEIVSAISED